MDAQTDAQLLQAYAERRSDAAFAELVRRHVDLVHSAARRMVCDAHLAEDVTQATFVALAKSAPQLTERPVLAGWLHRTAQNIAAQTVRTDVRRRAREQEAAAMNELLSDSGAGVPPAWSEIAPHLDAALGELNEPERDAVLLRYFQRQSAREMALTLGISDEAAQKRVSRAVDRLREFFAKRGVTVGASGLAVVISANAVEAAPVSLALTISAATALTGTTLATTATVAATKAVTMTALQKTVITAIIAVLAGVGIYEARQASQLREQVQTLQQQKAPLALETQQLRQERDDATSRLAALRDDNERLARNSGELLRLRGEVGVLRREADELDRLHKDNLKLQQLIAANSQAPVTEVFFSRLKQPQTISDEMIRSNIAVKVGSPYDSTAVDADLRNLYGTGWFRSVRVAKSESTKGIVLNYIVREKPKLVKVHFSGNSQFDDESLARLAHSKTGQLMDDQLLQADAERIQAAYLNAGFSRTTVKYVSNVNEATAEGSVDFNIVE